VLSPPGSPVKSRFTRTIQRIKAPHSIEESYDDGDLVGRGRWEFEPLESGSTRVSFYCVVSSNRTLMRLGFLLGGEKGHNRVYQELIASLKVLAEGAAG
jgi:hypothetical protein